MWWRRAHGGGEPLIIITKYPLPPKFISLSGSRVIHRLHIRGSWKPPLVDDERDRSGKRKRPRVDERLQEPTGAVGTDAVALWSGQAPRRARVERLEGRGDARRRELARWTAARTDAPRRRIPVGGPPRVVAEGPSFAAVGTRDEVADDPGAPSNPAADVDAGLDAPRQRGDGRQDPECFTDRGTRVEALLRRMGGNERERRAERRGDGLRPG